MQKIVLLMMANRTNHETGECHPSLDLLSKECGMEKRSVINQISKLESLGLVSVSRIKRENGMNCVNKYWLNLSKSSERDSPWGSERDSPGSERDSPGGSERDSPKPVTIEPIKEPRNIFISDDDDLTIEQQMELRPDRIEEVLWLSVIKARKKRKAVQTRRAVNGFIRELEECEKRGISFEDAIDTYLQKTWQGINADWIQKKPGYGSGQARGNFSNNGVSEAEWNNANFLQPTQKEIETGSHLSILGRRQ